MPRVQSPERSPLSVSASNHPESMPFKACAHRPDARLAGKPRVFCGLRPAWPGAGLSKTRWSQSGRAKKFPVLQQPEVSVEVIHTLFLALHNGEKPECTDDGPQGPQKQSRQSIISPHNFVARGRHRCALRHKGRGFLCQLVEWSLQPGPLPRLLLSCVRESLFLCPIKSLP